MNHAPVRAALYTRVSTADQTTANQLPDLMRYTTERNWTVQGVYEDHGLSGAKERRPALDKLMDAVRKRKVDVVLVWRFDRFARSVKHLILALEEFRNLGIEFISYQENLDTGTPLGQAIFTIVGAVAALERDIIRERVRAGLNRARRQGKRLGRPRSGIRLDRVARLRHEGLSVRAIARRLGVSKSSVAAALNGVHKTCWKPHV